ncbi:unnamed protein product (macronuclear) [Paramecium tetraurelia]|uniref:Protein kinase domain-containing protein n=1 Tax=Paramecium tetraurelia TaxID=5888 RepID=A0EGI6_PARTE|nr:uncharacterized protein GSPATT00026751001 [Paramecium tetraurelia]CAK94427.1 unnamed protein product [Paramecium tetraurelia]|eukprot:XP_001461800.1 hypothetical protein (macronuclear) [Paramecium tetraurelia strain d4-2]
MQQIHSHCPLCNQLQYCQTISTILIENSNSSSTFLEYVLNPIISVYQLTIDDQKFMMKQKSIQNLQFHHYDHENKAFPVDFDVLYGFDFFIQGCQFVKENLLSEANEHFEIFDKINLFTQPIFKRQIPIYSRFSNTYFNDVCDGLLNILKYCYQKVETNGNPNIKQFILQKCSQILQSIENFQTQSQIFNENSLQLKQERKEKLHRSQVQLACLSGNFTEDAVFTPTYYRFLQDHSHINQIGGILFTGLTHSAKLWEIFFAKLNGEQRLSHITSLVIFLNKQYNESYLICLLKLAKGLKRFKEYWLSLVIFSFFRKVTILFQKQQNFNPYLPFVYDQMAKICLYLGQHNEAYQYYLKAYEKSKNCSDLYIESKDKTKFSYKLKYKLMILALFLQHSQAAVEIVKELQSDRISAPYHINVFTNYLKEYLDDISIFNNTQKYRKCEQFLKHLSKVVRSNLNSIQIPQDDIKESSNLIELKDKGIPKVTLKQKIEYQFKFNSFFQILQFYLILVCHMKNDQLSSKHFFEQQEILDQFLQYIDCKLYTTLHNVIEQFSYPQDCYENLLMCHFYQYLSMYDQSKKRLLLYEKIKQETKSKYNNQESLSFNRIIENYRSSIQQNREETFLEFILPSSDTVEAQFQIGVRHLQDGRYKEAVQYLQKVGQNPAYRDLCKSHLLKLVQQSRENLAIVNSSLSKEDIHEIIKEIDFDRLTLIQTRRNTQYLERSRQSYQSEVKMSYNYLIESKSLSQISRNGSVVNDYYCQNSTVHELKRYLNDQEITELIDIIEDDFKNIQQFDSNSFQSRYPKHESFNEANLIMFSNENEKIVMKIKEVSEIQLDKLKSNLKDILVEILAQIVVNKLNYRGFAQLITLYYQFNISQIYASNLKFYLIFPYYEPLPKMNIKQLKDLTLSIKILNHNQFIHRDLKPQNILMKDGNPVIIDFDCSYFLVPKLQKWLRGKGLTNKYYPKNDVEQDKVDIYSLGIIGREIDYCPEEFYQGATAEYDNRYSLLKLLEMLN